MIFFRPQFLALCLVLFHSWSIAQTDYPKLIQIAKLYNEIKNSDTLHSIFSTDNRITWNVNIQSLNQIDRNIQRPM